MCGLCDSLLSLNVVSSGSVFRSFLLPADIPKYMCCCCCSVTKLCPTLCNPVDCSTPGFPVLDYLPEFATITASLYKLFFPQPWVVSLHQCANGHSANTQGHPLEIPGVPFFSFLSFIGCAWSLSWYVGSSSMA